MIGIYDNSSPLIDVHDVRRQLKISAVEFSQQNFHFTWKVGLSEYCFTRSRDYALLLSNDSKGSL